MLNGASQRKSYQCVVAGKTTRSGYPEIKITFIVSVSNHLSHVDAVAINALPRLQR